MEIDIPGLLKDIGVQDGDLRIRREAETVLRLSKAKCQRMEPKEESLRGYIVTDLALAKLGIPFSRESMIKAAHAKEKVYHSVRQRVRHLLGSSVTPRGGTVEQLAIKFPGGSAERSRVLLKQYEEECRSTVTAEKRQMLSYDMPLYHAAAFCVASVELKAKVNRKSVATEVQVEGSELDRICAQIVEKCGLASVDHISKAFRLHGPSGQGIEGAKDRDSRKRSPPGVPSGGGPEGAEGGDCSDGTPVMTRLDLPGSSSPPSPGASGRSGQPGGIRGTRLFVGGGPKGGPQAADPAPGAAAPRPPLAPDPMAPLKVLVKRLRTLKSPAYERWCEEALGSVGAAPLPP